jgi:glycosyltransferase involved in cell wall biosynthesis
VAIPEKVLITGGHEIGGVQSFAEGLAQGFRALGIPSEVIPPGRILGRWSDLRSPRVLKILSTTAVFAAPLARRAICMAHGVPRVRGRGWTRFLAIVASFKCVNLFQGSQLVAVSSYTAAHLETIFDLRLDGVILNPLKPVFMEASNGCSLERPLITYVGRLDPIKNLHRLLPPICALLEEMPMLRTCIIGEGEQKAALQEAYKNNPRIEFKGCPGDRELRDFLRRTRVFVSGHTTEGLGITYLEALSQGCAVAMPAAGGGLEIAPNEIGRSIHLLPLSFDYPTVLATLRRALASPSSPVPLERHSSKAVAAAYLRIDAHNFGPAGKRALSCPETLVQ